MDPITIPIVTVLGKYALDKGAEWAEKIGPQALETAKEMFSLALDRLRRDPKGEVIADEFEQDPDTYQKPVEKVLEAEVQADPDFAAQLKALFEQYQQEKEAHAAAAGASYQVRAEGSGGTAVGPEARATGDRGVIAEGDVGGSIVTGDHSSVTDKP